MPTPTMTTFNTNKSTLPGYDAGDGRIEVAEDSYYGFSYLNAVAAFNESLGTDGFKITSAGANGTLYYKTGATYVQITDFTSVTLRGGGLFIGDVSVGDGKVYWLANEGVGGSVSMWTARAIDIGANNSWDPGSATYSVSVTDVPATIYVNTVNDAPTATITPTTYAATEDVALTLQGTGLSIADVDDGGGNMTVTLSVTEGILTVAAGTTGVTITSGNNTGTLVLDGTKAQLNDLLAGGNAGTLSYTDNVNAPAASATLTLQVNDNGNTGTTPGALTGSDTATINITPANDAPINTLPGGPLNIVYPGTTHTFAGTLSVTDPDGAGVPLTTTVTVQDGTLTAVGASAAGVSGVGTQTVVLTGTAAQINAALNGLTYELPGVFDGSDTLTLVTNDGTVSDTDALTVLSNVPPAVTTGNISWTINGNPATPGALVNIGDALVVSWNNTAGGDNNGDIASVSVDFSQFGGGAAVAAANAGDTWSASYTVMAGASNGVAGRAVSVTATDTGALATTTADDVTVTLDNVAPAAPAGLDLIAGSDSGTSSTDDLTNDNTPTITGTGEVGATVTLTSSVDGAVGTGVVDGAGNWSITASTLANGAHNLTATQADVAGNVSVASGALAVTIDTTAPAAPAALDLVAGSDSGSSNTDNITNDTTPTITGTGEVGATVTLTSSIDGAVGTAVVDGAGNWSITASALSAGAQSLTATQTDAAGNTSVASGALAITIDTTALAPAGLDLVAGSDSGSSSTDNITNDNTPTITGTGEIGATVTLTSNVDGAVGSAVVDGAGNWSITATALTEGAQSLTAAQTDVAGNTSVASAALAITIDTTPPAAPAALDLAAASDSGSSSTDDLTNDNTPTINGTGEVGATVTLSSNVNGVVGSAVVDGAGNWSITASALNEGAHNLTATQTDVAGNTGVASGALAVTIDTTPPAAPAALDLVAGSDTGSSSTDNITTDNTPTITGTGEIGATVTLISSITGTVGTAVVDGAGNWSITSSVLGDGAHNLTATQTDVAGNTSVASGALAVTIDTSAPAAPAGLDLDAGSDFGISNSDNITNDDTPTINGTGEVGATVTLISDADGAVGTAVVDGSGNWTITATALTAGARSMTATQTDVAGNTSVASAALAFTLDTTPPAAPAGLDLVAGSDTGSSSTDDITNDTTPTVSGTGEVGATVTLYSTIDGTLGSAVVDGAGNWTITGSAVTPGVQTLYAIQQDIAGNNSLASANLVITVDTTPPAAPAALDLVAGSDSGSSSTDNITNDTTPTITGTGEVGATVTLTSNVDGAVGTAVVDGAGNWSITATALTEGAQSLTATQTDVAGNTSVASGALAITIDTTAPGAPAALDLVAGSDSGSSNTDDITSDTTPTITGTGEVGATVTLTSNVDGSVGTAVVDGAGNWSITATALTEGAQSLTATQTDVAGNTSVASAALALTIDTTPPAAPAALDLVAGSDSGSSNTDDITNDNTPTITGTGEIGATVTLTSSVDGSVGTAVVDGAGNWSITASTLADGAHNLTATQTDLAGNTSVASGALAVTIDTAAPAAPAALDLSAGSDSGSSSTDNITNDTTPTITGTGEVGATVTLTSNVDGTVGTAVVDGAGNWSITATALTEGAQSLTATQTDVAGNTSVASGALAITIDTTVLAPAGLDLAAASDSGSSNTDDITNDNTPTINGTGEVGATIVLTSSLDGALAGTATVDGSGNWSFTTPALSDGAHNLTAVQTDVAGNVSIASAALAVTIDTVAPAAPAALDLATASDSAGTGTTGTTSDDLTNDNTPTINGTGEVGATVTLTSSVDGAVGTATVDGAGNWSITASTLAEGAHNLTATQEDVAGNTSVASGALAVTIDTTAPTAPTVDLVAGSDSGVSSTDDITNDTTPTVRVSFDGTATAGDYVILKVDGGAVGNAQLSGGDITNGYVDITSSALGDGVKSVTATITDRANNTSAASTPLSVTIDTTPPAVVEYVSQYTSSGGVGTLLMTGYNIGTVLESSETKGLAGTDVKARIDWTKLVWDINSDDAGTANVTFAESDVTSALVLDNYTLQVTLTGGKTTALAVTAGYGASTSAADALDVTAGFFRDLAGNAATTDAASDLTILGTFNQPSAQRVYSYYQGDNQVTDEIDGNFTASNTIDFSVAGGDILTFFNMSAAAITSVGGGAIAGGAGNVTLGADATTITLNGLTSELDGANVLFNDGSVLKTNTGAADTLKGTNIASAGDQLIAGNNGDVLFGYAGNDVLTGGSGSDAIYGGSGNDTIYGKGGNDYLSGGVGSDTFLYTNAGSDDGHDVIVGFTAGAVANADVLKFTDVADATFTAGTPNDWVTAALGTTLIQSGVDTLYITAGGETIRLLGVTATDLVDANFAGV